MLKKIASLINPSSIDIYGSKPTIKVQGESNSYSIVGIIGSVFVGGFIIWATYFNSAELFQKTNPSVTTSTLPSSTINIPIELTPDVFDFSFGMYDFTLSQFYIDPSVYTVEAIYSPQAADQTKNVKLNIEPCYKEAASQNAKAQGQVWCISKNQTGVDKINLYTKTDSYLTVNFKLCNPLISTVTCQNSADAYAKLGRSFASRIYTDWKINPFNHKEPLQRYYKVDFNGLAFSLTKATYVYLVGTQFQSDDGWLLSSTKTQDIYTVERIESDFGDRTVDLIVQRIILSSSGNKNLYYRSYIKLQDVLAQIWSLCSGFIFLLGILILPYSNIKMYEGMINKLYHVHYSYSKTPVRSTTIDFKDESNDNRRFDTSNIRLNDDISMIDEKNKNTQRGLITNPDMSEMKITDQTFQNIMNYVNEDPSQVKDIEMTNRSRLRNITAASNNQSALQKSELDITELQETKRDSTPDKLQSAPDKNEKENNNESSTAQQDDTEKMIDKGSSCWKRRKNKITPSAAQKKNKLSVSYHEFILSFFRKKPKLKALEKASKQIIAKFDFELIFKKLHEIDRLKGCLMTQDQQILFNSIQKPILEVYLGKANRANPKEEDEDEMIINMNEPEQLKYSDIKAAYLNLKKEGCKTTLDRRLVQTFEQNKESIEAMTKR